MRSPRFREEMSHSRWNDMQQVAEYGPTLPNDSAIKTSNDSRQPIVDTCSKQTPHFEEKVNAAPHEANGGLQNTGLQDEGDFVAYVPASKFGKKAKALLSKVFLFTAGIKSIGSSLKKGIQKNQRDEIKQQQQGEGDEVERELDMGQLTLQPTRERSMSSTKRKRLDEEAAEDENESDVKPSKVARKLAKQHSLRRKSGLPITRPAYAAGPQSSSTGTFANIESTDRHDSKASICAGDASQKAPHEAEWMSKRALKNFAPVEGHLPISMTDPNFRWLERYDIFARTSTTAAAAPQYPDLSDAGGAQAPGNDSQDYRELTKTLDVAESTRGAGKKVEVDDESRTRERDRVEEEVEEDEDEDEDEETWNAFARSTQQWARRKVQFADEQGHVPD